MYITPQLRGDEKVKYIRKSQTDDPLMTVEEVLEGHERRIDEWVERNQPEGGPIPEENTYREIVSGETIADRPRMNELLRRIESPKIKAIVCVEPTRLSRGDLEDIGRLIKILRYTKTLVITMEYTYDLEDERDRELFERELKRGNEYLNYAKKVMGNGRLASVKAGHFLGSVAPFGYKKVMRKEGKKNCPTLEPHPEYAETALRIFQLYADGMGAMTISDVLNAEHVPTLTGKPWGPNTIYSLLANEHYIGKVTWGKYKHTYRVEDGEIIKGRPAAEDYLVFEGKHDGIIPIELWERVQEIRGTHPRNTKANNFTNPLAGLVWCECGRAMQYKRFLKKDGTERCAPRILCVDIRNCGTASCTVDELMAEVVKVLQNAIEDFELRIEAGTDDSHKIHAQLVARLEKRLATLRELEKKQWAEKIKGGMPEHVFRDLNAETVKEIEEVQIALCEAADAVPEPINLQDKLVTFRLALETLLDPTAPAKEKNQLLKACIDRIDYHRDKKVGNPRWGEAQPLQLRFTLRV